LQFVTWGVLANSAGGSVLQFVTWGVLANSAGGSVLQFVTWGVLANSAGGSVLQFVTRTSPQAWAAKAAKRFVTRTSHLCRHHLMVGEASVCRSSAPSRHRERFRYSERPVSPRAEVSRQ
jgi:hypothetical protein